MRILIGLVVLAVALPASANMLTNGSFEDGMNGWSGGPSRIDADQYNPDPATLDGAHKAGDSNCNARASSTYQSVSATGPVTLTGGLAGGDAGGYTYYVKLWDGAVGGTLLGQKVLSGINNWQLFSLSGTATGTVTVEFGSTGAGQWGPVGFHVDALDLTPEPASMALFALAGLPLLRRRR